MLIPTVIEKNNNHERAYDLYSRLLKDRIIFIGGEINDNLANIINYSQYFVHKNYLCNYK